MLRRRNASSLERQNSQQPKRALLVMAEKLQVSLEMKQQQQQQQKKQQLQPSIQHQVWLLLFIHDNIAHGGTFSDERSSQTGFCQPSGIAVYISCHFFHGLSCSIRRPGIAVSIAYLFSRAMVFIRRPGIAISIARLSNEECYR